MKFNDFTPAERLLLLLLHALKDEVQLLNARTSSTIAPGVWRESNELLRTFLRAERDGMAALLEGLRPLVRIGIDKVASQREETPVIPAIIFEW